MKKILAGLVLIVFIFSFSSKACALDKWENLLVESAKVFEEMTEMPDEGIPEKLLRDCRAIVIVPSTIGGGFIIGAKYGQGVMLAKDKDTNTWSAPSVCTLKGGSFGWQIGGQATDIILLVMTDRGLDGLLQSRFKLGGDAAIAAGPYGRDAEASTDLQLKGGILSYSRSRGLFVGIKLEGAVLAPHDDANTAIYNRTISQRDILVNQEVDPPSAARRLMNNLRKF